MTSIRVPPFQDLLHGPMIDLLIRDKKSPEAREEGRKAGRAELPAIKWSVHLNLLKHKSPFYVAAHNIESAWLDAKSGVAQLPDE